MKSTVREERFQGRKGTSTASPLSGRVAADPGQPNGSADSGQECQTHGPDKRLEATHSGPGRSPPRRRSRRPPNPGRHAQEWVNRRASAQATRAANARQVSGRRRFVDPTTCEREYTVAEMEFMQAMHDYKQTSGRMFPTWSEVLEVIKALGYEKARAPRRRPSRSPAGRPTRERAAVASTGGSDVSRGSAAASLSPDESGPDRRGPTAPARG